MSFRVLFLGRSIGRTRKRGERRIKWMTLCESEWKRNENRANAAYWCEGASIIVPLPIAPPFQWMASITYDSYCYWCLLIATVLCVGTCFACTRQGEAERGRISLKRQKATSATKLGVLLWTSHKWTTTNKSKKSNSQLVLALMIIMHIVFYPPKCIYEIMANVYSLDLLTCDFFDLQASQKVEKSHKFR